MSIAFELEYEVIPPPLPTQTEIIRIPPRGYNGSLTALGGDYFGSRMVHYEYSGKKDFDDHSISSEEFIPNTFSPQNIVDTITYLPFIPINRMDIKDTI